MDEDPRKADNETHRPHPGWRCDRVRRSSCANTAPGFTVSFTILTSNHEDTNDLLQEIFAKAHRSIKGFRGKSSFYTWIHSIGVNMSINFLKKRGRHYQLSLDDVDANIQNDKEFIESTSGSNPVREADLKELHKD